MSQIKSLSSQLVKFLSGGFEAMPHIGLLNLMASQYITFVVDNSPEGSAKISKYIGFNKPSHIMAKTRKGLYSLEITL